MSVPRPVVDDHAREVLDGIEHPITIAVSVRGPDGGIADFRTIFANTAAARWAGVAREASIGRLASEVVPAIRTTGLLDVLANVVETGEPFSESSRRYEGALGAGGVIDGSYDVAAMRLGDGYVAAWRQLPEGVDGEGGGRQSRDRADLLTSLDMARRVVHLVRLEARTITPSSGLRLRPA